MLHSNTCRHVSHFGQSLLWNKRMENNIAVCTSPLTLGFIARARFRAPHPLKDAHIPPTSAKPLKSQQNQSDLLTKPV